MSGIRREVLGLYRTFVRAVREQPQLDASTKERTIDYIRNQFIENKGLRRSAVLQIEYLLRRGRHNLEVVKSPGFKGLSQ